MRMYRAVVVGSTGAVGKELVRELIASPRCSLVTALARRPLPSDHQLTREPKLQWRIVDFENLAQFSLDEQAPSQQLPHFDTTAVFCALGTTAKKAGSSAEFFRIDHDHVLNLAHSFHERSKEEVSSFAIVSSMGANANSWFLYPRTKGLVEDDLQKVGFQHLAIFRPSLLEGEREESRPGESVAKVVAPYLNPLLVGSWLRKYRSIHVATVAKAMVRDFEAGLDAADEPATQVPFGHLAKKGNVVLYESDEIAALGASTEEQQQA